MYGGGRRRTWAGGDMGRGESGSSTDGWNTGGHTCHLDPNVVFAIAICALAVGATDFAGRFLVVSPSRLCLAWFYRSKAQTISRVKVASKSERRGWPVPRCAWKMTAVSYMEGVWGRSGLAESCMSA